MKKTSFGLVIFLFVTVSFWAISQETGTGNPTAGDILGQNPNADILKLDGLIYMNRTDTTERTFAKGKEIGEIKGQSSTSWWFWNLYATKLPEGAKIYTKKGVNYNKGDAPFTVLVEHEEEIYVYKALVEG